MLSSSLGLPAFDGDWESFILTYCVDKLERHAAAQEELASAMCERASDALRLFDEAYLALRDCLALVSLLSQVHPSLKVRTAAEGFERRALLVQAATFTDTELYDVLCSMAVADLDDAERHVRALLLRDFRRAGVLASPAGRARLHELTLKEAADGQEFIRAIRESKPVVRVDGSGLSDMPKESIRGAVINSDGSVDLELTTSLTSKMLTKCSSPHVRASVAGANLTRAWPSNDAVLESLLSTRLERAQLLGYSSYAQYQAEVSMAQSVERIEEFLVEVSQGVRDAASREYRTLLASYQADVPSATRLTIADLPYYLSKVRHETYGLDPDVVSAYLNISDLLQGILGAVSTVFGLSFKQVHTEAKWHPTVKVLDVYSGPRQLGRVYLDLYSREGKYGQPAAFTLQCGLSQRRLAEAVLSANLTTEKLAHGQVVQLFHEFGHVLHELAAGSSLWGRMAGLSGESDFLEAPAQLMEECAWDPDCLRSFARNDVGEAIPTKLIEAIVGAARFGRALSVLSHVFYSAVSLELHRTKFNDVAAVVDSIRARYSIVQGLPSTYFHTSFEHLEGYGSGYYAYLWSRVIAKDLYSAFNGPGLSNPDSGRAFWDRVLAPGDGADAAEMIQDFLGRPFNSLAFREWVSA